jgi:aminoglycoside phosphotransferase (APT) family kinase protein
MNANADRLGPYLDERLPGRGELVINTLRGGLSNELLTLGRANQPDLRWVLRRPPGLAAANGAHDLLREARILQALDGTDVPHGHPLLICDNLDVLGVPFFVLPFYDGLILRRGLPDTYNDEAGRTGVWHSLIDSLVKVHGVQPTRAGLPARELTADHNARQLNRWLKALDGYDHREVPQLREAGRALAQNPPAPQRICLIHGDFGFHNVLFERAEPRVQVILDWETATAGDPLVDLAHFLSAWLQGNAHRRWFGARPEIDLSDFPPASVLADRYSASTGLSLDRLDWYLAFSRLRIAVILEGAYGRYVRGENPRPEHAALGDRVVNIADQALAIIGSET